jgi:hypothetical protein
MELLVAGVILLGIIIIYIKSRNSSQAESPERIDESPSRVTPRSTEMPSRIESPRVITVSSKPDIIDMALNDQRNTGESYPYKLKTFFFSKVEKQFYDVLNKALNEREVLLFSKVRLLDVLINEATQQKQTYHNKIQSRHLDFLVCNKKGIIPLLAIELTDSNKFDNSSRDEFITKALAAAGLPLLRLSVKRGYSVNELDCLLEQYLGPVPNKQLSFNEYPKDRELTLQQTAAAESEKGDFTCAHCGKPVSLSVAKFCLSNPRRFDLKILCMEHQNTI